MKVAVYGSLKRGGRINSALNDGTYLGNFKTHPEFTMVNLGAFPGVLHEGKTSIHTEVYEIPEETLRTLDRIEGYPSMYDRENIETPYGDAWMYIYNTTRVDSLPVVTNGNWPVGGY